jgi:hypothetical protein
MTRDRMMTYSKTLGLVAFLCALSMQAQTLQPNPGERLSPLHAMPRNTNERAALKVGGLNEHFLYNYQPQTLPVVDDFSIDRTQHQWARSTDPNVTLQETFYHLVVGGQHPAVLELSGDPTFLTQVDTTQTDTGVVSTTTLTELPSIETVVFDLSVYPPTSQTLTLWPSYSIYLFEGEPADTTAEPSPDYFQDSLLVYSVAADTRTYTRPDNSTVPLILWQEDAAYVNNTYGDEPPTIGVATFDGMDRTGYPINPDQPTLYGMADSLTSVLIDLTSSPSDSVYLSFFIQPIGRSGDYINVQSTDSLRLEFMSNNDGNWDRIRSWPQTGNVPFRQIMVPIVDPAYLQNNFRMRFVNFASYGGAIDQWHIDYVRLGRNRSYTDTVIPDVSFMEEETTLLDPYTSVPYDKFRDNPSQYMAQYVDILQRNIDDDNHFITWKYYYGVEGELPDSCDSYGNNLSNNANTIYNTSHPIAAGPCNNIYPTPVADAVFYRNEFVLNASPDINQYNDSVVFLQELSNYYSYDDGSAEWGYSLENAPNGKIAYRFDTQGEDSLRAIRMYFDPIFSIDDPTTGNFLITVWSSVIPEAQIYQNISFSTAEFNRWGPDHFVEYDLDETIPVSGTFYVGWTQTSNTRFNLGLDVNRVNNDRMWYNVSGTWLQSGIQGSWMIRPVMVSAVDPFASVPERDEEHTLSIRPNPTNGEFTLDFDGDVVPVTAQVLDAMGREVLRSNIAASRNVDAGGLLPGLYLVRALDTNGSLIDQQRLIIAR